jgi:poly(3-hydroxybutyrate) depolymerase
MKPARIAKPARSLKGVWPFAVAGGATALVIGGIAVVSWPQDRPVLRRADETPPAPSTFCAAGLETLADDACFAPHDASRGLVVYLHGRYSNDTANEELDRQSRVARLAGARGYAVLALRGVRGECTADDYKNFFCWPSNPRNAADASAFVARMTPMLDIAKTRASATEIFLLGFSNGGYFASLLAERALLSFDAIAIAHGGPTEADSEEPARSTPLLLVTADDDAADPEMQSLDRELTRRKWPHEMIAREGGHALPDWDITMALTFFDRTRREKLPLVPPLARRETHRADPDAGADDADQ